MATLASESLLLATHRALERAHAEQLRRAAAQAAALASLRLCIKPPAVEVAAQTNKPE